MKYRLIATDMDGTLLDKNSEITDFTREAVKKLIESDIKFILCTGRPLKGVEKYVNQLGLDCPIITYNGAVITHSRTGENIFSQDMDKEEARRVYNLAVEKGTMFIIWSQNKLYASEISEKTAFYEEITSTKAQLIEDFEEILSAGITKMLWYDDADILDQWVEELKLAGFNQTTFVKSRRYFLEFFSNKTSKAVAMEKLGEYYGIKREEMIALGDQTNDLPMIEYAGLGIAMGNAVDSVKAAAGYIADTNENDGAAKAMLKFTIEA